MKFEIQKLVGAGGLRFGMSRKEVRDLLPQGNVKTFSRVPGGVPIDDYPSEGLQAHFSASGELEFLEFFPPAQVSLNGTLLLDLEPLELERELAKSSTSIQKTTSGFRATDLGVAVYAPTEQVESVSVFPVGYFE